MLYHNSTVFNIAYAAHHENGPAVVAVATHMLGRSDCTLEMKARLEEGLALHEKSLQEERAAKRAEERANLSLEDRTSRTVSAMASLMETSHKDHPKPQDASTQDQAMMIAACQKRMLAHTAPIPQTLRTKPDSTPAAPPEKKNQPHRRDR